MAIAFFAWSLWPGSGDGWIDKLWWSFKYDVAYDDVHVPTKPKDCNFLQAPLGIKGCKFEPIVAAYNADGVLVGGEHAPKYGLDTKTGKPIISYNDGKSWDWYPASAIPDQKIKTVQVSWTKTNE